MQWPIISAGNRGCILNKKPSDESTRKVVRGTEETVHSVNAEKGQVMKEREITADELEKILSNAEEIDSSFFIFEEPRRISKENAEKFREILLEAIHSRHQK